MNWENDALSYEKYLVLAAIGRFSESFEGKQPTEISMRDLIDFVDDFMKSKFAEKLRKKPIKF